MKKCLIAPFIIKDSIKILLKSDQNKPNIKFNPITFKFDCEDHKLKNFILNGFNNKFDFNIKKEEIISLGDICNKIFLYGIDLNNKDPKLINFNEKEYSWASYFLRFDEPFISMLYIRLIGFINLGNYNNSICPECKRPLEIKTKE